MKKIICLLTLFLSGCGGMIIATDRCLIHENWSQTSGLNVCSETEELDLEHIDFIVSFLETEVPLLYPEVSRLEETFRKNNLTVLFINANLSRYCVEIKQNVYRCEHIYGVFFEQDNHIYVEYKDCIGRTSLAHELLHAIEKYYLDGSTPEHTTPKLFRKTTLAPDVSVELKTLREAIKLCVE